MDPARLSMSLGEAMSTQRSIRRFRTDPIAVDDIHLILDAAVKAPNGGNFQPARFLVVTDRARLAEFGALYRRAWWAKRHDEGFTGPDDLPEHSRGPAGLADRMGEVPCVVFVLGTYAGSALSVVPAAQNLMLAARALGIGSVPTTLHPSVMDDFRAAFDVPESAELHFCIPLGHPQGAFGPTQRRPTSETAFLDRWGAPVPWA